jgi:kynurenine formamidase
MRMRVFLKTGRARYWWSLPRPGQQLANPGVQAEATEWLRQRWTAAVRHWSRGLHCARAGRPKRHASKYKAVKGTLATAPCVKREGCFPARPCIIITSSFVVAFD